MVTDHNLSLIPRTNRNINSQDISQNDWPHYENMPIQIYTENFTTKKMKIFRQKISDIFHISAQNINCGYSLKPPRQGGYNEYPQSMFWAEIRKNNIYPCKPQFYYTKVWFKGVKIL